jgi:hypothetical protein
MKRVLIVGVHSHLMERVVADVRNGGHDAEGVLVDQDPVEAILHGGWDAVAIGGGVEETVRAGLHASATTLDPTPEVIDVYGPGTLLARLDRTDR